MIFCDILQNPITRGHRNTFTEKLMVPLSIWLRLYLVEPSCMALEPQMHNFRRDCARYQDTTNSLTASMATPDSNIQDELF